MLYRENVAFLAQFQFLRCSHIFFSVCTLVGHSVGVYHLFLAAYSVTYRVLPLSSFTRKFCQFDMADIKLLQKDSF